MDTKKIEIFMDDNEPPYVLVRLDEASTSVIAVEDALPRGWTVGAAWTCGGKQLPDGRWKLPLTNIYADHEDRMRRATLSGVADLVETP